MNFEIWKNKDLHQPNMFIEDGIINKAYYDVAPVKILYLLKEAWGEVYQASLVEKFNQDDAALCDEVWVTVAKWHYGITQYLKEGKMPLYVKGNYFGLEDEVLFKPFLGCAVVNVKKSNGKTTSSHADLKKYATEDRAELKAQIDAIEPDLIVCGNTMVYYQEIYDISNEEANHMKVSDAEYLYRHKERYIIDYWHPANRVSDKLLYYGLEPALRGVKI